ncbi:7307_t:CDS:2, partial [Acaulospora colombiana]
SDIEIEIDLTDKLQGVFYSELKVEIPRLFELFHLDYRGGVTKSNKLTALKAECDSEIKARIPRIVELIGTTRGVTGSVAARTIKYLANQGKFLTEIKAGIPRIVESVTETTNHTREARELMDHLIKQARIPHIIELLASTPNPVGSNALDVIGDLSTQAAFHGEIRAGIPTIVKLLVDSKWGPSPVVVAIAGFHSEIKVGIPRILEIFSDLPYWAQYSAITAIASKAEFHMSIKVHIPKILDLFVRMDPWDQREAAKAISNLATQVKFEAKDAIIKVVELLADGSQDVRNTAIKALGNFAIQEGFRHDIQSIVPHIMERLLNRAADTRGAALEAIQ